MHVLARYWKKKMKLYDYRVDWVDSDSASWNVPEGGSVQETAITKYINDLAHDGWEPVATAAAQKPGHGLYVTFRRTARSTAQD